MLRRPEGWFVCQRCGHTAIPEKPEFRCFCQNWLDLGSVATVEVTSETKDHPVESALLPNETRGWRAAQPGAQIIRLLFDHPQKVKRIPLVFEETEKTRTQEFVLRWSADLGRSFRDIVRQQWNFSRQKR